jgi:hypothetical protein
MEFFFCVIRMSSMITHNQFKKVFPLLFLSLFLLVQLSCTLSAAAPPPTQAVQTLAGIIPTAEIPAFPWPPPDPSATSTLSLGTLGRRAGEGITLGDVNQRIIEALDAGGYDDRGYYSIPGGFALVTRMEQIQPDGSPKPPPARWVTEIGPMGGSFNLGDYLKALFGAPKGYYRLFVFFVTSQPVSPSGTGVPKGSAVTWQSSGASSLPSSIAKQEYTPDFTSTVYIYQFEQTGIGEDAEQNVPSTNTGKQHLQNAKLWDILEK